MTGFAIYGEAEAFLLTLKRAGLYCPAGDFYIDPSRGVDRAVITHAHSDHARRGSKLYYSARSGLELLRARLGQKIQVEPIDYGKIFSIGPVQVSLHPAGHVLGSAQVRLKYQDQVWVVSGDYKREPDPTCEPFEVVPCDVFITEATFGTPGFTWNREVSRGKQIYDWWEENSADGVNSVLFAYSLGKAQRVLGELKPWARRPIFCHPAVTLLSDCYRAQGIALADTICLSTIDFSTRLKGELILTPHSFLESEQAVILDEQYETAFASGWTVKSNGYNSYGKGFVMSDHADWNDLVRTVVETRAREVYVLHRGNGALVRHLRGLGIHAHPISELMMREPEQLNLL